MRERERERERERKRERERERERETAKRRRFSSPQNGPLRAIAAGRGCGPGWACAGIAWLGCKGKRAMGRHAAVRVEGGRTGVARSRP